MPIAQGMSQSPQLEAVPLQPRVEQSGSLRKARAAVQPPSSPEAGVVAGEPGSSQSPFLPMLLTLVSLLVWFGFQGQQLWVERGSYKSALEHQAQRMSLAQQVRSDFDSLKTDTARLAAAGNSNAQILVDALKKHGVTVETEKK